MTEYVVLNVEQVIALHEGIIASNELQGLAKDKSLDAVLDRVHNRLRYGFVNDVCDLAACYATFIAKGHCFNDANKRTAATSLYFVLVANGIEIDFSDLSLAQWVLDVATDQKSEVELAAWLRNKIA
ncbi:MAG: type II toxin-antitoxin system death-on-curing family toxin [Polynucleobacter victoriensis]